MRPQGRTGRILNLVGAILVAGLLFAVAAYGGGPLPPLGPAFNPGTGVWTAADRSRSPRFLCYRNSVRPPCAQCQERHRGLFDLRNWRGTFASALLA